MLILFKIRTLLSIFNVSSLKNSWILYLYDTITVHGWDIIGKSSCMPCSPMHVLTCACVCSQENVDTPLTNT